MNILTSRSRHCFEFPAHYGRLFGEGSYVLSKSNHRWPKDGTLQDAIAMNNSMVFAANEAERKRIKQETGKHVLVLGPHGLWQVTV